MKSRREVRGWLKQRHLHVLLSHLSPTLRQATRHLFLLAYCFCLLMVCQHCCASLRSLAASAETAHTACRYCMPSVHHALLVLAAHRFTCASATRVQHAASCLANAAPWPHSLLAARQACLISFGSLPDAESSRTVDVTTRRAPAGTSSAAESTFYAEEPRLRRRCHSARWSTPCPPAGTSMLLVLLHHADVHAGAATGRLGHFACACRLLPAVHGRALTVASSACTACQELGGHAPRAPPTQASAPPCAQACAHLTQRRQAASRARFHPNCSPKHAQSRLSRRAWLKDHSRAPNWRWREMRWRVIRALTHRHGYQT